MSDLTHRVFDIDEPIIVSAETPPMKGWICPRCDKVHSPHVTFCLDCWADTEMRRAGFTEIPK